MYHYVYKLTHIETNEFYFGSRSSECHPTLDTYYGSMKVWRPDKTKLIKNIIDDTFSSRIDAMNLESKLIEEHINDPLNRNYHIPSKGYHTQGMITTKDKNGNVFFVDKNDSRFLKGELVGISKHMVFIRSIDGTTGLKINKDDLEFYLSSGKYVLGRKITPEIQNSLFKKGDKMVKDRIHFTSIKTNKTICVQKDEVDKYLKSDEFKLGGKKGVSRKGIIGHKNQSGTKNSQYGTKWITNGLEVKKIKNDEELPEGWKYGCINKKMLGVSWITNGSENKRHPKNEPLPENWYFGKIQRKNKSGNENGYFEMSLYV